MRIAVDSLADQRKSKQQRATKLSRQGQTLTDSLAVDGLACHDAHGLPVLVVVQVCAHFVAEAAAATFVAAVTLAKMAMLEHVSNLPCCRRNVRTSAGHFPVKAIVLRSCNFTSKQRKQGCTSRVSHKRGHLAVLCSASHQWCGQSRD